MKYLLAIWDGGGATPPNLGVARLLVERGHDVVALADRTLAADVAATGAEHREWPTAPQRLSTDLDDDVLRDWECRTPIGAVQRLRDRLMLGPAAQFADDVVAAIDGAKGQSPFDAVLADGILLGALVGAEARGMPAAALVGSCYLAPSRVRPPAGRLPPARGALGRLRDRAGYRFANRLWDAGLDPLNEARSRFGLAPLLHVWEQWDRAQRVLMLTASVFDDPPPDATNVRYVGPVLDDITPDAVAERMSGWVPGGAGPLIVVGLSSSYMQQRELLQRIADALSGMAVRAVITTGPAVETRGIRAAPHVNVVRSAPHTILMAEADLVITHAGHGTLIKAIAAGVPALCIPLGRDQPDNAARARRHGVAEVISARADAATIAATVSRMLGDPTYRRAARALGAQVSAERATDALRVELEGLPGVR